MIRETFGTKKFKTVKAALKADTYLSVDTLGELRELTQHLPDNTRLYNCDGHESANFAIVSINENVDEATGYVDNSVGFYTVS